MSIVKLIDEREQLRERAISSPWRTWLDKRTRKHILWSVHADKFGRLSAAWVDTAAYIVHCNPENDAKIIESWKKMYDFLVSQEFNGDLDCADILAELERDDD